MKLFDFAFLTKLDQFNTLNTTGTDFTAERMFTIRHKNLCHRS